MDLDRLLSIAAAPFCCMFLIVLVVSMARVRPQGSVGHSVPVVRIHHDPQEPTDCGGRTEFIRLTKDGRTWINEDQVPANRLVQRIAGLMKNRAERVVYFIADSELSFGQFAEFLDKVSGATSDLRVVVVSGEARRAFEKSHDVCDFVLSPDSFRSLHGDRESLELR